VLRVSRAARAVRQALFASAGLLALSGPAWAGTCVPAPPAPPAGTSAECDGVFNTQIFYTVDDLTLVVGGNDPATAVVVSGADGIQLSDATSGDISLYNYGDVSVDIAGVYGVNAIDIRADGDILLVNGGDVSSNGDGEVFGAPNIYATAVIAYSYAGDIAFENQLGASISSHTDTLIAYGAVANAYGSVSMVNHGDIDAYSADNIGFGMLATAQNGDAYVANDGNILVDGGGAYRSMGMLASAAYGDAEVVNLGGISVTSGSASAQGIVAQAPYGTATATNGGDIAVDGALPSFGVVAIGADAALYNGGDVTTVSGQNASALRARALTGYALLENDGDAAAIAGDGYQAFGIAAISYLGSSVYNAGDVSAQVDGNTGTATAVYAASALGDVYLANDGTLLASGGAYAVGVAISAAGNITLVNSGSIVAQGGAVGSYSIITGGSDDSIQNTGDIVGSILTGAGADSIANGGSIDLSDAFVDMGTGSNSFANSGVIHVDGSSAILMGGAYDFSNDGLVDLRDGATDDTLYLAGNLAGDGYLAFDVNGADATADRFYIEGNVASASTTTVDIAMVELPADGSSFEVPLIHVSGDSDSGNFLLGEVANPTGSVLDMAFSLVGDVDASNASDDIYSLRAEVLGLGETGLIAAAVAPGVQVLLHSVVGTLAQRDSALGGTQGRFGVFARVYRNQGTLDLGEGELKQRNSGGETGFDFAGSQRFSAGLLFGKANADQGLRGGSARDSIDGDVTGAFGTMRLPRGLYADLSHRRLKFDARMQTPDGIVTTSGVAETSNAEGGYKWKSKRGLVLEGQYQVTRTRLASLDMDGTVVEFRSKPELSVVSRLGLSATKYFEPVPGGTLWEVHANANFIRESGGKSDYRVADAIEGSTDIGGNSTLVEIGFTGRRGLLLMFGGLSWQDGGALQDFFGGQLGAKYTW
jgi:hypothetical protein